jgi:hypothetical protein
MTFKNLQNNYEESSYLCWLWCLLFGGLYFAVKGVWTHFFIAFLLAILTGGISWIIYPFFAGSIIRKHYMRKGWVEV